MTLVHRIIRSEHYEIKLVTKCLLKLADALQRETWNPDFDLLFLILHYSESFPETFHHPKEDDYLFEALRIHSPDCSVLLDGLSANRADGITLVSDLRQSLEEYAGQPAARGRFCDAATLYGRHQQKQMRQEERTVLPLALKVFGKEEWQEIDAAFERNDHPLLCERRRTEFDKLFALILRRIPGPIVFGPKVPKRKKAA